ncbi:tetratricopeptide repeat protein [Neorhodopirellula lusitana]|uniref:tetratricopeptide repeat protein n=1 Tax=Neorhodopirellula lusitana TaxID=445327 RepID=UPI00384DFD11
MPSSGSPSEQPTDPQDSKAGPCRRQELEHRLRDLQTDRDAYLELASIYRIENRPLNAAQTLKKAHEVFPNDTSILWEWEEARLARSMQQLGEVREMAAKAKSALADTELERSQTDWATCRISVCQARIARDPEMQHLRLVLGEALYDMERYEEALAELKPLEDVAQHSSTAAFWQGRCHLIMGNDGEAMRYLRNASLRRAVPTHTKVRVAALKLLIDLAERHGLTATLEQYQSTLASLLEAESNAAVKASSS